MAATKQQLIKIADELFQQNIIGKGMLRDNKYDICNGFIEFSVISNNPKTFHKLWEKFEELGYIVKHGGYDYLKVYWNEDTRQIDSIFAQYK